MLRMTMAAGAMSLLTAAAGDNVVRILPPLTIDESHVRECVEKLSEAGETDANAILQALFAGHDARQKIQCE